MGYLSRIILLAVMATGAYFDENQVNANDPVEKEAEQLVRNALQAELEGRPLERKAFLAAAIKADPSFAPARWHSGQIRLGSKGEKKGWLTIEEAESKAAADSVLSEYATMRRSKIDNADGNELLAIWCQRRGLQERARIHWSRVLQFQPNHKTAVRCLGLREFQNGLYTREQIAHIKDSRIRATKLQRQWQPKLNACRKAFLSKDSSAKENAAKELRNIAKPELVGLIESQLSGINQEFSLVVVDAIGSVKEQVATESLVRHATLSKWSSVRSAATEKLKGRPMHGYVPILIDAMMSPYHFQSWSVSSPLDDDHVLALNYSVGQRRKHADHVVDGSVNFLGGRGDDRAEEIKEEIKDRIEKLNEEAEKNNKPIWQALQATTGQQFEGDPSQWNDWWNDYNEYHVPEFRPVFTSFRRPSTVIVATQPFSCFPAGIKVSTQTGQKKIEDIRVGDYVLSQNAVTGELAYKPVVETAVRQSDAILNVSMNGETLLVTRGHPMWVNGRQWQMAKQLKRGDVLHSANGPVEVEAVRSAGKDTKVYNLVVAEFNTYFVGDSRVLVHDNSIYVPPGVAIPGE